MPDGFCRTTMPLAFRWPRIWDGLTSLTRFQTTDEADGWTNAVVSPAPILKLCQLMTVLLAAPTVSIEPDALKVAAPCATLPPVGLAPAGRWAPTASASANAGQHGRLRRMALAKAAFMVCRV